MSTYTPVASGERIRSLDVLRGFAVLGILVMNVQGFSMPGVALGYLSLIMLAVQKGIFANLQRRLAAVGRLAFTNYILQTVLCTTLFYGYGFGLFGSFERYQQLFVVLAVWLIQLWLSPVWLRYFAYGPLEWAWRALTYWYIPKMRLRESPAL